jgi:predicted nucleotidyltransferase
LGSILTNQFSAQSDINLIVDFYEMPLEQYANNYYDLKSSLETILKRSVDLLEGQAIRNPFFKKEIQSKQQLIYEHSDQNLTSSPLSLINDKQEPGRT